MINWAGPGHYHASIVQQSSEQSQPRMPGRIRPIHRIPHAVHIGIQPTPTKRAPTVRTVETHQSRVVGAVAVTQQVPADLRFAQLTIETQARDDLPLR